MKTTAAVLAVVACLVGSGSAFAPMATRAVGKKVAAKKPVAKKAAKKAAPKKKVVAKKAAPATGGAYTPVSPQTTTKKRSVELERAFGLRRVPVRCSVGMVWYGMGWRANERKGNETRCEGTA